MYIIYLVYKHTEENQSAVYLGFGGDGAELAHGRGQSRGLGLRHTESVVGLRDRLIRVEQLHGRLGHGLHGERRASLLMYQFFLPLLLLFLYQGFYKINQPCREKKIKRSSYKKTK